MSQSTYQIKQAWMSLKQKPGFVATVVTTMGTTLGALLCISTLAYLMLIEPLPYPEQSRLVNVTSVFKDKSGSITSDSFTYPGLVHLYKNQDVFEQSALLHYGQDVLISQPRQPTLNTAYTTPEWFVLLGAKMELGRAFEATEALDTFNPVAIISYKTWQQEFDSNPSILEQSVTFNGVSYKIVGVLSKGFIEPQITETGREVSVWLPWDYNLDVGYKERWGNVSAALTFVGLLKEDVTARKAALSITPLVNNTWLEQVTSYPVFKGWSITMEVTSFKSQIMGGSEHTVHLLLICVWGLVFIAFANIINLFMSRVAQQRRKMAIHAVLGAKKSHLFNALLAESSVLMMGSILLALVIASSGFALLQAYLSPVLPRMNELSLSVFTFSLAILIAILFAVLIALLNHRIINYQSLNSALVSSGKGLGTQVSKRVRQTLIVSQVALATLLVFANITVFKESVKVIQQPLGLSVENLVHIQLSVPKNVSLPEEEFLSVMKELKHNLLQLPQVDNVSRSESAMASFSLIVLTALNTEDNMTTEYKHIDELYFSLIEQSLIEGIVFNANSREYENMPIIINDVFAKRLNPNGSALGYVLSPGRDKFIVTGVVSGIKMPNETSIPIRAYLPSPNDLSQLTLKLANNQLISREQVLAEIQAISQQYSLFNMEVLDDVKTRLLFTQYTTAITTSVLTFITLFLASIGLYGILSYSTQMRRFELGTRMAIGAKRKQMVGLIIKDNAWVIAIGMATSVVVMLALYITFQETLNAYLGFYLLGMFALTVFAIGLLSLFACYWPLRQYINQTAIHSLRGSD